MKWKNPPARQGSTGHSMYELIGDELMKNPNRWALIREDVYAATKSTALAMFVKHCDNVEEHWDVVSRTENDQVNIYARYIPNGKK